MKEIFRRKGCENDQKSKKIQTSSDRDNSEKL